MNSSPPCYGDQISRTPARRFYPPRGQLLTFDAIRGPWRPSGTVAGAGVFAVVWSSGRGEFWAPLHDFAQVDQLRLIDECRSVDYAANGSEYRKSGSRP